MTTVRTALVIVILLSGACVHRPYRAECQATSFTGAVRGAESALRLRYANVYLDEAQLGRLRTDERYEAQSPTLRTRAYVAIAPGDAGWLAEITVIREKLQARTFDLGEAPAGWVFDGRDAAMERFLAEALGGWLQSARAVFVDSAPASAPASGPSR